ncbi:MAG: hypothetical protein F6J93_19875 [Oscillatoria sp. SIO1A7]|nr:hypothetical protein [Oscillatoria sp. SIO1A7]
MKDSYPDLGGLTVRQLREFCKERKITGYSKCPRKADLLAFIREWIAENDGEIPSEVGGEAPQATEGQSPDVVSGNCAAGKPKTPDVAQQDLELSTTSGASELLPVTYSDDLAMRGLSRPFHHLLYNTETKGQLLEISSTLDRSALSKQKSPQVGSAIADKGRSAIPWGDCDQKGANPINNLAEMGVNIFSIAAVRLVRAANPNQALGGIGGHWANITRNSTELWGITVARKCITITAFFFRASICLGPNPLEAGGNSTPHLPLTQPSYMDRARQRGSLLARTNPPRAP